MKRTKANQSKEDRQFLSAKYYGVGGRPYTPSAFNRPRELSESVAVAFIKQDGAEVARCEAQIRTLAECLEYWLNNSQFDSPADKGLDSHRENVSKRVHIAPENWTIKQEFWAISRRLVRSV